MDSSVRVGKKEKKLTPADLDGDEDFFGDSPVSAKSAKMYAASGNNEDEDDDGDSFFASMPAMTISAPVGPVAQPLPIYQLRAPFDIKCSPNDLANAFGDTSKITISKVLGNLRALQCDKTLIDAFAANPKLLQQVVRIGIENYRSNIPGNMQVVFKNIPALKDELCAAPGTATEAYPYGVVSGIIGAKKQDIMVRTADASERDAFLNENPEFERKSLTNMYDTMSSDPSTAIVDLKSPLPNHYNNLPDRIKMKDQFPAINLAEHMGKKSAIVEGAAPLVKQAAANILNICDKKIARSNLLNGDLFEVELSIPSERSLHPISKKYQDIPRTFSNFHLAPLGVSSVEEMRQKFAGQPQRLAQYETHHNESLNKRLMSSGVFVIDFVMPLPK